MATLRLGDTAPDFTQESTAGTIRFAPDKSLLVSVGEGAHFNVTDAGGLDPDQFLPGRSNPVLDMGSFRNVKIRSGARDEKGEKTR